MTHTVDLEIQSSYIHIDIAIARDIMNRYTDATGAVYTVQSGYQTGDFVLLCDDGVSKTAWRMPKKHLRDAR